MKEQEMTPADLEAVARLLGYANGYRRSGTWWFMGGAQGYPVRIGSDWDLAGACLEKLAAMGVRPKLRAARRTTQDWDCSADGLEDFFVGDGTAPAAIIACAAAVQRARDDHGA